MKLLKDTISHISDHGLSVEFSDPKLTALIAEIASKRSGELTKLEAGKSGIQIRTIGNVTFTTLYDAVGDRGKSYGVHYFDSATGLKYSVGFGNGFNSSRKGENGREIVLFLWDSILGEKIESNYYSRQHSDLWGKASGDAQDKTRSFLRTNKWCLLGESGLRAKAIEASQSASKQSRAVDSLKSDLQRNGWSQKQLEDFNLENTVSDLRSKLDRLVSGHVENVAKMSETLASVNACENEQALHDLCIKRSYEVGKYSVVDRWESYSLCDRTVYFPSVNLRWSMDERKPNYTMSLDGENIRLSSGIVCPFSVSQALTWLKEGMKPGELDTRYGVVSSFESHANGVPYIAIKCGCHILNPARDLGGEFAELLTPTHKVQRIEGEPELALTAETFETFKSRLSGNVAKLIAETEESIQRLKGQYVAKVKELRDYSNGRPEKLATLQAEETEIMSKLATAKHDLELFNNSLVGTRIGEIDTIAEKILFALMPSATL